MGIIYKATNLITGKCYIGQTIRTLNERICNHLSKSKNNRDNYYFHKSIRKYGIDNFKWEVVCECNSKEELNEKEQYFIKELNTKSPNGYNLTNGGEGTFGYIFSDEERQNRSKRQMGKNNTAYLRQITNNVAKDINVRKKISEKVSGENNGMYNKGYLVSGKNNGMFGRSGANSPSSKYYKIIYSDKIEIVKGLKHWCKENNFNYGTLRYYINKDKEYCGFKILEEKYV